MNAKTQRQDAPGTDDIIRLTQAGVKMEQAE